MIVGAATDLTWKKVFDACLEGKCLVGAYDGDLKQLSDFGEGAGQPITLIVLIGAALVDSINPCTIAIMVMLLAVILRSEGRGKMLLAASVFISIIFFMYLAMGIGLLHAVGTAQVTDLFFKIVTALAFILTVLEFNAYFNYKPGFLAVEMPLFLRPLTKIVLNKATTIPGVALAAIFCSLFLIPCSSGPYLTVLAMLAHTVTAQALIYLVVYNIVFVLPMIVIALAIYYGKTSVETIEQFKNEKVREIHLFSGIILLILFLIMLAKVMGYITF
jgi:cytochrome c biogenesis protein CcdA